MLVAVIVLAVVAVAALMTAFASRKRAANTIVDLKRSKESIEAKRASLEAEVDEQKRTAKKAKTTISKLESAKAKSNDKLKSSAKQLENAKADLKTVRSELKSAQKEFRTTKAELVAGQDDLEDLNSQLAAIVDDRDKLTAEIEAARAAPSIVLGDQNNNPTHLETLWNLEVARSERTWRNSVAVNPEGDPSPFGESPNPVQLAVEIEAAALREDVGAIISIDWQAAPISDPARRHLVLRVAQEILAAAARETKPSTLVATGGDTLVLELLPTAEDDDQVINLIAPQIDSNLVDVQSTHGLRITVRAD